MQNSDNSDISSLSILFDNISIDSILDIRNKIRLYDGAYRRGLDIIIVSHSIRTVRGNLKYTFLDGNPPHFHNFSLQTVEETDDGKSYFMLDGNTPYSLSLLEASYVLKLMDADFIPSLYYSYTLDDLFVLNVDGTEKFIYSFPFQIQYIQNHDVLDYVIHYSPIDCDGWCEPITLHQAMVISRIFLLHVSELCTFVRD